MVRSFLSMWSLECAFWKLGLVACRGAEKGGVKHHCTGGATCCLVRELPHTTPPRSSRTEQHQVAAPWPPVPPSSSRARPPPPPPMDIQLPGGAKIRLHPAPPPPTQKHSDTPGALDMVLRILWGGLASCYASGVLPAAQTFYSHP